MNTLFAPGIKAMALFGARGGVVLIVLLFLVPLLISIGYAAEPWATPAIWGTYRPETEESARPPLRSLPALPRKARALPR